MCLFQGVGGYLCSSRRSWHHSSLCRAIEGLQRLRASSQASWWAHVYCSQPNMVEMRSVMEPETDTHRWLTAIEGCPLSAAWPQQQLRNARHYLMNHFSLLRYQHLPSPYNKIIVIHSIQIVSLNLLLWALVAPHVDCLKYPNYAPFC